MALNPLRLDPTRSISLRRSFNQSLSSLFNELMRELRKLIVEEDAFGLKPDPTLNLSNVYEYASTQVNITDQEVLNEIERIRSTLLPEDVLKLSGTPHVTIRYGLFDQMGMLDAVRSMVYDYSPIEIRIGKLSVFDTPKGDVIKFEVESQQLREMNARLDLLPNYQEYSYNPHITVAYVPSGKGESYVHQSPIEGKILTFDYIYYSDGDSRKTKIPVGQESNPVTNKRWKYQTQSQAVDQFDKWVSGKIDSLVLSAAQAAKWKKYIQKGFEKGANRAFDDTKRGKADFAATLRQQGFVEDRREQFTRQSLNRATAAEKLKLLEERALAEVVGMTRDLKSKARRLLTDSLVKGLGPVQIAANLSKLLNISKGRAQTIANTELVRAHSEGQLEAMEQLGVSEVGIAVEWSTAFSACKVCQPLKGIVLSLPEARGMLPRHPNCRCAWIPAGVGEDKTVQKRGKYKIDQAIKQSQKRADDGEDWGPAKDIARKRPITNTVDCGCSDHLLIFSKLLEQIGENQ